MPSDINFTFLTGTVISVPSWVPLAHNKRALVFTIRNNENFKLADGRSATHVNNIVVEVLGRNADKYFSEIVINKKVQVVGYIRVDEMKGSDRTRVRAFRIEDISGDE